MPTHNIGACACCGASKVFNGTGVILLRVDSTYDVYDSEDEMYSYPSSITAAYADTMPRPLWSNPTAEYRHSWIGIGDDTTNAYQSEDGIDDPTGWIEFVSSLSGIQIAGAPTPSLGTDAFLISWNNYYNSITLTAPFTHDFTVDRVQYRLTIPTGTEFWRAGAAQCTNYQTDDDDLIEATTYYYCYDVTINNQWIAKV